MSTSFERVLPSAGVIPFLISYRYLFYRHETDDTYSFDHGLQFLVLTFLVLIVETVFRLKRLLWLMALPVLVAAGVCRTLSERQSLSLLVTQ